MPRDEANLQLFCTGFNSEKKITWEKLEHKCWKSIL